MGVYGWRRKEGFVLWGVMVEEKITSEEQKSAHPFNVMDTETLRREKERKCDEGRD
jgi:hypothetical protein